MTTATARGGDERTRRALGLAAGVLPPGERLVGSHHIGPFPGMPRPRKRRRPVVLRGRRMPGDRLARLLGVFAAVLSVEWNPVEAAVEAVTERERHKGQPFFGGWDSLAGQLALAVLPRAKTGVEPVLALTDRELHLVYVHHGLLTRRLGEHAEPGWSVGLGQLAWIRDRSDLKGGTFELGFVDGSWATVRFAGSGWSGFAGLFPRRLSHRDPIP